MNNQDNTKNAGFQNTSSPSELPKGKNYLLAIGIDKYTDLPPLYNAVKDAQEVVDVLLSKYQFEQSLVMELYNDQATKRNIYRKLRELTERVTPKDNVLIYFSGHGEYDKMAKEGYWIPVNAENGEESDYIPNTVIRKKLGTIKSHHTFLMADSCFAGSLFARSAGRNVGKRYERDPSRWGLTAGRNEIVSDGKAGYNSPFAESLLYRLRNNTGALNVQELCAHVTEYVLANSNQTPIGEPLQIEGHKNGQFVFHLKKDELVDWKATSSTGTLQGYQLFLLKYPDGQYAAEASTKIKTIEAAEAWTKLKEMPEISVAQIQTKLKSIRIFTQKYPHADTIQAAELLGENLHYKVEFLGIQENLFALKRFARKNTPYREAAKERIAILEKEEWETEQAKQNNPTPPKKTTIEKEQIRQKEINKEKKVEERKITPSKPKQKVASSKIKEEVIKTKPSFFKKNAKYLIPILLIPFLIWGVWQWNKKPTVASDELKIEAYQDTKTQLWGYKKGEEIIITAQFSEAGIFENGQAEVIKDSLTISINTEGECIANCPPTEEEIQKADEDAWNEAQLTNSILAYESYQQNNPNGKYFSEASQMIEALKWEKDSGTLTDTRDGQTYKWAKLKDGRIWMTENLNYDTTGSYCCNCDNFGRHYTWDVAIRACPSGWHLPTDDEWKNLRTIYGGYNLAYKSLTSGRSSDFGDLLGAGLCDDNNSNDLQGVLGYYWSSNGDDDSALSFYFRKDDSTFGRIYRGKYRKLSCRCVKDIPSNGNSPLELSYQWGKDQVKAIISGGTAPYELRLERSGKMKYSEKVQKEGTYKIDITEAYREDAGNYELVVEDAQGNEINKIIHIDPPAKPKPKPLETGTLTDTRDGQTYKWVRLKDGKIWMAENLNLNTRDSYCYNDNANNCRKYGRLYIWQAAKSACPDGWHLPSGKEWYNLYKVYGGRDLGYKPLIYGGNSGFAALLGGRRNYDGEFLYLGSTGHYWSATDNDNTLGADFYVFYKPSSKVNTNSYLKSYAMSCRCVKD